MNDLLLKGLQYPIDDLSEVISRAVQGITDPAEKLKTAILRVMFVLESAHEGLMHPEGQAIKKFVKELEEMPDPEAAFKKLTDTIDEVNTRKQRSHSQGGMQMVKNASQYTERLDKIAEELVATAPEMAMQLDIVSDILDGKRTATSIQFDADEARFMAGRFNYNVRQREADEPYMDSFNQSNFEQVKGAKQNPTPIKLAYQKVQ